MGDFPENVVVQAWERSRGFCECKRTVHRWHYWGWCSQRLVWEYRGQDDFAGWVPHHKVPQEREGSDDLSNCEIVCRNCYKQILAFG